MAVERTPEERARRRMNELEGLLWHLATFVIINGFLWFIDLRQGGAEWAYWVTISWGIGVLFHIASYIIDESGLRERRYQKFLAQEQARDVGAIDGMPPT